MTPREAALILGLRYAVWAADKLQLTSSAHRQSAGPDKIKQRHRKLLMMNHPDTGGSTFIASKINEAKDMMLGKTSSTKQ